MTSPSARSCQLDDAASDAIATVPVAQNHAANGHEQRDGLGLGASDDGEEHGGQPVPDRGVAAIAAPRPDSTKIDSYWPHHADTYGTAGTEQHGQRAATTAQRGRSRRATTTSGRQPRSASDAGHLHQRADARVGRIGHGRERRLEAASTAQM